MPDYQRAALAEGDDAVILADQPGPLRHQQETTGCAVEHVLRDLGSDQAWHVGIDTRDEAGRDDASRRQHVGRGRGHQRVRIGIAPRVRPPGECRLAIRRGAAYGSWTTPIREILNQGGEVGRLYGQVWEDFLARSFEGTGWSIIGRNINLVDNGRTVTEIDLLLFRDDLLVAAEIKALTGSGHSPYDHWKNRMIIEKGCRQALLASQYLSAHREVIASIANRMIASAVRHIQPLVLTSEHMFDG